MKAAEVIIGNFLIKPSEVPSIFEGVTQLLTYEDRGCQSCLDAKLIFQVIFRV